MSPDIKIRRASPNAPLATPIDCLDFATHIDDYVGSVLDAETADDSGSNMIVASARACEMALSAPVIDTSDLGSAHNTPRRGIIFCSARELSDESSTC